MAWWVAADAGLAWRCVDPMSGVRPIVHRMELVLSFISTFIGSAGLVSLVTAIINRDRQSKARRFLEDAKVAREATPADSHALAVLDQAVATTTLRLAAPVFRTRSAGERMGVFAVVLILSLLSALMFGIAIGKIMLSNGDASTIWDTIGVVIAFTGYLVLAAGVVVFMEQRSREDLVYQELLKIPVVVDSPEVKRARKFRRNRRKADKAARTWADKKWARARRKVEERKRAKTKMMAPPDGARLSDPEASTRRRATRTS